MTVPRGSSIDRTKDELRVVARERRKATVDRAGRSTRICRALAVDEAVLGAAQVLSYRPTGSEVDVEEFAAWCRSAGKQVRFPEDGVGADWPDVIIVPALAFTVDGRRLGQGAGWYDRFLPGRRVDCVTIGVGFSTQVVTDLPTADHDVVLDRIITDLPTADHDVVLDRIITD
jgi:5-formyltetrahydrofolate cyclo-ligase